MEISIPDVLCDVGMMSNVQLPDPSLYNYFKNLDARKIWIDYDIDSERILEVSRQILMWNRQDRDEGKHTDGTATPICLFIYSPGGEVEAAISLINVCELSKTPIHTFNMGTSMSAALWLLIAGHKRFALHGSRAMIHSGSGAASGTFEQVEAATQDYKKLIAYTRDYVLRKTKIDAKVLNKYKKEDWYMYAEDQLKYGVVDEIITDIDVLL